MSERRSPFEIIAATPERWGDFMQLLGPTKGGSGGCWCMLWRYSKKEFEARSGEQRRDEMQTRFEQKTPPGVLAYDDGAPVGWCSVAPRAEFPRLESSRILKPVDSEAVWSITCFYVAGSHRKQGVSIALLNGAADFAAARGAQILEGYPVEPGKPRYPAVYAWVGLASAFQAAGFEEVARRSPTRPIMRRRL